MHARVAMTVLIGLGAVLATAQPAATQSTSQPTTRAAALPAAVERVLQAVPDDTHLLVVVPSVDTLARGVGSFCKAASLPVEEEISAAALLSDLLEGAGRAIDADGPLVLAVSAEREEPLVIATLKSVEPLGATAPPTLVRGAEVYELKHEQLAAVTPDRVVIFGRERVDVEAALGATGKAVRKLTPEHLALLARRQVLLWVDVAPWEPTIQQGLNFFIQMVSLGAASAGPEGEAAMQFYRAMFDLLGKVVREADNYAAALQVDERGVFFEDRATFKADGAADRFLADVRPGRGDLLRGLPAGAVMTFGAEWESVPGAPSLNEAVMRALMSATVPRERVDAEKLERAVERSMAMYRTMTGFNGALLPAEGGGMLYAGLHFTKDADALVREMRVVMRESPELLKVWSTLPTAEIGYEAETVDGTSLDCYLFNFGSDNPQIQPMLDAFYGKDASMYCLAAPQGAVYAMGPRAQARSLALRLKNPPPAALSEDARYATLLKRLSPHPQFCLTIDLPATMQVLFQSLEKAGMPLPPLDFGQSPAPLAGAAFYVERPVVRFEILVPAEAVGTLAKGFGSLGAAAREPY